MSTCPSTIQAMDEGDAAMDELCDMLAGQPLWCGEENSLILQCSFDVTRRILENMSGHRREDTARHISEVKKRYTTMLRAVPDWLLCEHLKPHVHKALEDDDPATCLFVIFYVDHELIRLCNLSTCELFVDE